MERPTRDFGGARGKRLPPSAWDRAKGFGFGFSYGFAHLFASLLLKNSLYMEELTEEHLWEQILPVEAR